MINKDFFKKIRILDGGMGQELLARGMKPNSTLWSANAILDANFMNFLLNFDKILLKFTSFPP